MNSNQDRLSESSLTNSNRPSILLRPPRRSTFLVRPLDQNVPIQEDPNNTPERNKDLFQEYKNLQVINSTLGKLSNNLEATKNQFNIFNDTIDRTNGLLDKWLDILGKTEEIKSLVENPDWHGSSSMVKL